MITSALILLDIVSSSWCWAIITARAPNMVIVMQRQQPNYCCHW